MKTHGCNKATHVCPCGYNGDEEIDCRCTPDQIRRYQSRVSGPFLDRIDILMHVPRIKQTELRKLSSNSENSETIRQRVEAARNIQFERQGKFNATLSSREMEVECRLTNKDAEMIDRISEKMKLSLRSHMRVQKVARTIADLDLSNEINSAHLLEAVSYRSNAIGE